MSSRLYRAIIGVGISLGTTMSACGAIDTSSVQSPSDNDAGAEVEATPRTDAAGLDASKDVILDAFCDATWPTTKGNSGGPTCGPTDACADSGPAPRCFEAIGPSICESHRPGFAAWCVGGEWKCSHGSIPGTDCKCWGPLQPGQSCP